jgi:hypothetical protein
MLALPPTWTTVRVDANLLPLPKKCLGTIRPRCSTTLSSQPKGAHGRGATSGVNATICFFTKPVSAYERNSKKLKNILLQAEIRNPLSILTKKKPLSSGWFASLTPLTPDTPS